MDVIGVHILSCVCVRGVNGKYEFGWLVNMVGLSDSRRSGQGFDALYWIIFKWYVVYHFALSRRFEVTPSLRAEGEGPGERPAPVLRVGEAEADDAAGVKFIRH